MKKTNKLAKMMLAGAIALSGLGITSIADVPGVKVEQASALVPDKSITSSGQFTSLSYVQKYVHPDWAIGAYMGKWRTGQEMVPWEDTMKNWSKKTMESQDVTLYSIDGDKLSKIATFYPTKTLSKWDDGLNEYYDYNYRLFMLATKLGDHLLVHNHYVHKSSSGAQYEGEQFDYTIVTAIN